MPSRIVTSGLSALDHVLQGLRLGDNVVWQVDRLDDYRHFAEPFSRQAIRDGRRTIYFRFAPHAPILPPMEGLDTIAVNPHYGFDAFSGSLHQIIEAEGREVFYIFDSLSALVVEWATDDLLANFFQVTCPFLFELDTVAYFALTRGQHSHSAVARIRDTTQLLLDVYQVKGERYIQPLKVWDRYSPQMFLPHIMSDPVWTPIFRSGEAAALSASAGRGDATARGGLYAVREAAKVLGIDLFKATIAVQGYGNAGYYAACLAQTMFGSKVIAVSDSKGCVLCDDGLDAEAVGRHKEETSSVCNFPGANAISNEEILDLDVDILFPSALENVITKENAPRIKAKIVAELANGPTTPEADEILHKNGVHVIPDFLCNAGGVTVSYFEMVQNFYMYYWDMEEVRKRLDQKMTKAYHAVLNTSKKYNINMRQAAYVVAVERVAEAMRLRGWA